MTSSAVISQYSNESILVSALSTNEQNITLQNSEKTHPVSGVRLDSNDILQAQRQDYCTSKVLGYKEKGENKAEEKIFRNLVEPKFCYLNGTNFMLAKTVHYAERRVNMTN